MKSVFTFLWCIKLQFDPSCVYFTSFILDILLFLWMAPYGFGYKNWWNYWPNWIFAVASFVALLMAIFAVIQLITKSSTATTRHATYAQCRLNTIIGLAIGAIILFVFAMVNTNGWATNTRLEWSLKYAAPLILSAIGLHSYHENFV